MTRQEIDRGWLTGLPCGTRWKRGRAVCSLQRRRRAGVAPWAKPQLAAPSCYPRPNFEIRSLFCRARALSPPGPPASSEGTFHSFSFLPHTIAHRSLPAPLHPSMSLPHFRVTSTVPYQADRGRMHHPARTTRCASSPPTPQACCAMTTDYSPYQFCLFLDSFLT